MKTMTKRTLDAKLKALGKLGDDQKREIVCSLIGHSKIQSTCFGYYYCGRCSAQLGDSLGSFYPGAKDAVVIGHNCETCRANYEKCDWRDKLMVPDPFAEEVTA